MRTPYDLGLEGRVVLVTGGVRGVGAGISQVFADQGATVVTCARRPGDAPYEFHSCDVRDEESVDTLIGAIVAAHGRLDAVVNNAGGAPFALAADASHNFHRKIIELNLLSALLVSQRANAVMQKQDGGGTIVNITSVSAGRPSPGTAAYGAAKAGLESLTRSLAVEWAPKVRVNALAAGMIRTELLGDALRRRRRDCCGGRYRTARAPGQPGRDRLDRGIPSITTVFVCDRFGPHGSRRRGASGVPRRGQCQQQ